MGGFDSCRSSERKFCVMAHVGGRLQAEFMVRVRGRDLSRCLVVPVDVGKSAAMALIADHYGEIVVARSSSR